MEEPQEVEAHETYCTPRGPKQPPLGSRTGVLKEPVAQVGAIAEAAGAPPLDPQVLAGDDAVVDRETVEFLLLQTLLVKGRGGGGKGRKRSTTRSNRYSSRIMPNCSASVAVPGKREELVMPSCCSTLSMARVLRDGRSTANCKPLSRSEKGWKRKALDCSDGEPKVEQLCAKFVSKEVAVQFKVVFNEAMLALALSPYGFS